MHFLLIARRKFHLRWWPISFGIPEKVRQWASCPMIPDRRNSADLHPSLQVRNFLIVRNCGPSLLAPRGACESSGLTTISTQRHVEEGDKRCQTRQEAAKKEQGTYPNQLRGKFQSASVRFDSSHG